MHFCSSSSCVTTTTSSRPTTNNLVLIAPADVLVQVAEDGYLVYHYNLFISIYFYFSLLFWRQQIFGCEVISQAVSHTVVFTVNSYSLFTSGHWVIIGSFNSLAPWRSWCDFKNVIFNLALLIGIFKSSYDNVLRWMSQDLTDDKSTLVPVMAWCRQATSHYMNQCWPRSATPYGVTGPQWVNSSFPEQNGHHFTYDIFNAFSWMKNF